MGTALRSIPYQVLYRLAVGTHVDYAALTAWGTFIGGIGTAAAFLGASYAFVVNAQANRSAQARVIYAHLPQAPRAFDFNLNGPGSISTDNYADTHLDNDLVSYEGRDSDFIIEDDATLISPALPNRSDGFIFDVELTVFGDNVKWSTFRAASVPPGSEVRFLAVLSPEHRTEAALAFDVTFTDAVGRRWVNRSGQVARLQKRIRRS